RCPTGIAPHAPSRAPRAARTARSTSTASASWTCAITLPSTGLSLSHARPVSTNSPPTTFAIVFAMRPASPIRPCRTNADCSTGYALWTYPGAMDLPRLLDGRLKLRHLTLVDALSERGSLVGAAAHLRVTQPVLTRALRDLEEILG